MSGSHWYHQETLQCARTLGPILSNFQYMQPNKKLYLHLITAIEHFHLVVFNFQEF